MRDFHNSKLQIIVSYINESGLKCRPNTVPKAVKPEISYIVGTSQKTQQNTIILSKNAKRFLEGKLV